LFPRQKPGSTAETCAHLSASVPLSASGGATPKKAGLGSSIVEALAKQLNATVRIASAGPGAAVSVTHA
jgi:hypothetical protein